MSSLYVNPLREYRYRYDNGAGLSISQLANRINVSESTVIRTEQGLYHAIPPRILTFLDNSSEFLSRGSIISQYARFQASIRNRSFLSERFSRNVGALLAKTVKNFPEKNPALLLRKNVLEYDSRLKFCQALCLHPSTIKRFEDGLALSVPEQMRDVFINHGFMNLIDILDNYYGNWKNKYGGYNGSF